ncbi:MAG: MarR family transcriptional regulator [Chloroflexi bacterium]|nr:MarR family transcriptional regulator [Chloroflexota bacterium]
MVYKVLELELTKVGVTPMKTYVLEVCKEYRGSLTPAEISRLFFRESQTIAGLLARMEREGLIRRVPKRKGHPFTEVEITAKGEELLRPAREAVCPLITRIMSSLSVEEHDQFQNLLLKVRRKALEELHIELRPLPSSAFGEA